MKKIIYILIALAFVGGVAYIIVSPGKPGKYDQFAQCVKDKGALFYGAFWCPHCQAQKARFGKSAKYLPYVECSMPDGQTQTQICKDKGITTYPTWVFPNGEKVVGEIELADIATKTSCQLPN